MDIGNLKNSASLQFSSRPKPSSSHSLAEVGLLLVIIGLFYWFLVQPKRSDLSAQQAQLAKLQENERITAANLKSLQKLIGTLKSHPEDVVKLDEALPLQGKSLHLRMLISTLAQSAGVTVGDINVVGQNGVVAGNKELLKDPFAIQRSLQKFAGGVNVMGNYSQLKAFLNAIENNARIMNVNSLQLSGISGDQMSLRLDLEAYYYE